MEPKLHRRVQRYGWDLAVADYDRYWVPVLRSCSERCLELVDLRPGERVLDVASGTGVAAFLATEDVGASGHVVSTDISEKMVIAAKEAAAQGGVTNMSFERVDADYDANGFFGVDDSIPPGFDEVRYSVTIASAAPKEQIEALVEEADRYSSILDVFRRALRVKRDLRITSPVAE